MPQADSVLVYQYQYVILLVESDRLAQNMHGVYKKLVTTDNYILIYKLVLCARFHIQDIMREMHRYLSCKLSTRSVVAPQLEAVA